MNLEKQETDNKDVLIRKGWRGWLTLYVIWAIPALLMTSGYTYGQIGMANSMAWWILLIDHMWYFSLFAALSPLMYRVIDHFPFTRASRRLTTEVHILGGSIVVVLILFLSAAQWTLLTHPEVSYWNAIYRIMTNSWFVYRSLMTLIFYAVVVGSMIIVKLNRQRKIQQAHTKKLELQTAQLESQLNRAKLQTLKMQLRPHFLFNALNTISALVESKQNDRAFKTIAQLGDLLRSSLKLPDSTTIPLHLELEFIEKYLTIERIRFSDRLQTRTDVSAEYLEVMVPALILQPLVENCIHHAAAAQSEPLQVTITAFRKGNSLVLEVHDDGPGLPQGWDMKQAGVGLGNVGQRLNVMYGKAYGLELFSPRSGGVTAQVTVPFSQSVTSPPELLKEPAARDLSKNAARDLSKTAARDLIKPARNGRRVNSQPGDRELEYEHSYHNS